MATVTLRLQGLTCDNCVKHIMGDLHELDGIDSVEVTREADKSGVAIVTGESLPSDEVLVETVKGAGDYTVTGIER